MSDIAPVPVRDEADIRGLIGQIVRELAPNPDGPEGSDGKLIDDFEYTSLALLELAFTLEDEFELPPIDEETGRRILTVRDVENHVVNGLREHGRLAA
ncbi:MAG: acyl carrier protein [Solirubrobacteraceae bacterium]